MSENNVFSSANWFTREFSYEGLPLFIRKPDISNIFKWEQKFKTLLLITHELEEVMDNGLPKKDYNLTLATFDHDIVTLFGENVLGFIFLVETFGGERNYYYFTNWCEEIAENIKRVQEKYPSIKFLIKQKYVSNFNFAKDYPFELYSEKNNLAYISTISTIYDTKQNCNG